MRRRVFIILLVLSGCATVPPTPDAKQISRFDIEGEKQLAEGDIKDKIVTTQRPWYSYVAPFIWPPEFFDPLTWQADLRRITRFYEARGYYQARILDDAVTPDGEKFVKLLVRLREGDPARIRSLAIVGLEALPEKMQAEVKDGLPLTLDSIFLEDDWANAKALLALRLRELGFAEVAVKGEATVDVDESKVDLALNITPGPRYKIGKLFVATDANAQVPAKLIADVASPDVPQGEYFSESALQKAQARVFQMGVFAGVKVNRGLPDRANATVPVVIDTREAPFRSFRLGGGLGGDLIRQEVRVVAEYTNRNLGLSRLLFKNSLLDRLTLKGKLGLAFVPNVVDVIRGSPLAKWGPVWRLLAEYEIPRLFELRTLALQTSVEVNRTLDNAFDYDAFEPKLGVVWRPTADVTIFPSLNANIYLLRTPFSLQDTGSNAALGCPTQPNLCVVGYLNLNAEWDHRDNRQEPKEGWYLAIDAAGGLSKANEVRPFLRFTPEARGYVSFGLRKQLTIAARVKLGALFAPENDTPIVMRYFSGGSGMRGFQNRRLSPLRAVPTYNTVKVEDPRCAGEANCPMISELNWAKGKTLPVGGSGLLEASVEVRWAITEDWVVALFNDWGAVTVENLFAQKDFFATLYTAVGLGVRYRTPLGPIRVDLAFRLPMVGKSQVVDPGGTRAYQSAPGCFFGLGSGLPISDPYTYGSTPAPGAGMPDNLCSAHLSIGEAF